MHSATKKSQRKASVQAQEGSAKYSQSLKFPAFFPDATYAAIHSVPFDFVKEKLTGLVVTTLHMHMLGLDKEFTHFGSYKKFAGIDPKTIILSDSGGFQVLSLIIRSKLGKFTKDAAIFKIRETGQKVTLTPELSQQIQHNINSDIRVVLDVPLWHEDDTHIITEALETTTSWADRAKNEFLKLNNLSAKEFEKTKPTRNGDTITFERPLLNAVVQGGNNIELRKRSGQELSSIGFDLYGFGGWPIDQDGKFLTHIVEAFIDSLPRGSILYGMGIGTPDDIELCYKMGIELFDCVIPTRNARHGTLYVTKGQGEKAGRTFDVVRIKHTRYQYDEKPIDPACDCPTCKNHNRSYLRFLLKNENPVGYTLASVHNVWWYLNYMQTLQN